MHFNLSDSQADVLIERLKLSLEEFSNRSKEQDNNKVIEEIIEIMESEKA